MTAYTLLPARLALRTTTILPVTYNRLYHIHGATVLFLKAFALPQREHRFPVDFLVVSQQCIFDPEAWYHTFRPRKIIIDGSLPRWKALLWKQKLERMGAHVHWVQDEGAWVFPALATASTE
jgi:hypothetical protein